MSNDPLYARWDEISELLEKAEALPADQIDAFCKRASAGDNEFYALLLDLIDTDDDGDQKIHASISHIAEATGVEESLSGTTVGAYRVEDLLGSGGMGSVYRASRADGEFEKSVAVKVVHRRLPTEASVELFRNERQVLATLNHPSIPALVDSGQLEDGRPYFIFDYIEGDALDDYCAGNNLSVRERLALLQGIGTAVQHAHTNLVLHLDIKPKNVLIQPDGTPSLLDFGVARLIGDKSEGKRAFSPGYASPEQIRGERLTAASDVYSLGALMFRLLAEKAPFSAPSQAPSQTILAQRAEFVQRLASTNKLDGIDADLRAIVQMAMSEQPADRYPTVDAFLSDLKRYRNLLPLTARDGTFAYRAGKYMRRHRIGLSLVAVSFAALGGFALREADLRQRAQEASAEAAREAETARQVSSFMVNVFEVANPSQARGEKITARELLDRAAQRIEGQLDDQPVVAANLMRTMGGAYAGLGLHKQATPMLERTLAKLEYTGDTSSTGYADVLLALGQEYDALARHSDARDALTSSLAIRELDPSPNERDIIETLIALARLNTLVDDLDEAQAQLTRAQTLSDATLDANDPLVASRWLKQAFLYSYLSKPEEGLAAAEAAIRVEKTHGSKSVALAEMHLEAAASAGGIGRAQDALAHARKAIAIYEAILAPDHPKLSRASLELGLAQMDTGDNDGAETSFLRALEISENALSKTHPATGFALGYLGDFYFEQGRFEECEAMLRRSLDIMRANHPESHTNVSVEKQQLARVVMKLGNYEESKRLIDSAIANLLKVYDVNDLLVLDARWLLADILYQQGRLDEAATVFASVFALYTVSADLPASDQQKLAEEYAAFLNARGESVSSDTLMARFALE